MSMAVTHLSHSLSLSLSLCLQSGCNQLLILIEALLCNVSETVMSLLTNYTRLAVSSREPIYRVIGRVVINLSRRILQRRDTAYARLAQWLASCHEQARKSFPHPCSNCLSVSKYTLMWAVHGQWAWLVVN